MYSEDQYLSVQPESFLNKYKEVIMRITTAVVIAALFAPALSHAVDIEGQDGGANILGAELAFKLDKIDLDNPKRRFTTISMGYAGANGEYDQYMTAGGYNYLEHNKIKLRIG